MKRYLFLFFISVFLFCTSFYISSVLLTRSYNYQNKVEADTEFYRKIDFDFRTKVKLFTRILLNNITVCIIVVIGGSISFTVVPLIVLL